MAHEIKTTYEGMMIAVPKKVWEDCRSFTPKQAARRVWRAHLTAHLTPPALGLGSAAKALPLLQIQWRQW